MGGVRVLTSAYLEAWAQLHPPLAFVRCSGSAGRQGAVGIVRGGGPLLSLLLARGSPPHVPDSTAHVRGWLKHLLLASCPLALISKACLWGLFLHHVAALA